MAEEPISDNPRKLSPLKALAPIGMMVALFILTIGLALVIAPLYLRQGLQAFGEEGASNPLIAVYYLVMILIVTGVILLLRKFLKKKKRKFLKYILGAAVLISTYAVIWPILSAAVYGLPPEGEEHELSVKEPVDGIQPSTLIFERSFGQVSEDGKVTTISGEHGNTYSVLGSVVVVYDGEFHSFRFQDANGSQRQGVNAELGTMVPTSAVPVSVGSEGGMVLSLDVNESEEYVFVHSPSGEIEEINITMEGASNLSFYQGPSTTEGFFLASSQNSLYIARLTREQSLNLHFYKSRGIVLLNEAVLWARYYSTSDPSGTVLIATDGGLWILPYLGNVTNGLGIFPQFGNVTKVSNRVFPDSSLIYLAQGEKNWEIVGIKGSTLYVITEDDETLWSISDYDYVMIFEDHPGGTLTVVSSELVEQYSLPELHNTTWIHITSFLLASGLVVVLFIKPKWWIVDIAGILMGAGVLSLIGISLSILPLLLFLILLAVYDAISVYKTKHMLTLAESVVESKLPILLVFPQKMGYKYEEEKDLLDRSRPREALFMGLGDVIIPGTLVVSASTFLAGRDGLDILGMQPQYIVVLASLIGLLIGYSALMYFVLKGRPQAGLPLLNSGTILGFLIGELIAFGTIIIV